MIDTLYPKTDPQGDSQQFLDPSALVHAQPDHILPSSLTRYRPDFKHGEKVTCFSFFLSVWYRVQGKWRIQERERERESGETIVYNGIHIRIIRGRGTRNIYIYVYVVAPARKDGWAYKLHPTFAPFSTYAFAIISPMPRLPPVMTFISHVLKERVTMNSVIINDEIYNVKMWDRERDERGK